MGRDVTWGVVTTALEPPPLVAAFAAHYAKLGAQRIHIFLDRPDAEAEALLARVPGCLVTVCDEAYFRGNFNCARPDGPMRRQRLNATLTYRNAAVDWLLHVDADEFVPDTHIGEELAHVPEEVDALSLPNLERAYMAGRGVETIFDGVFRRAFAGPPEVLPPLLGEDLARFTIGGFCGHSLGKSFTRTGRDHKMGLHAPRRQSAPVVLQSRRSVVCHYDGLTPLHWALKLARYVGTDIYDRPARGGRHRYEQMQFVKENAGRGARIMALHDRIRVIPEADHARLSALGYLEERMPAVADAVREIFGEGAVDLSPAAFDGYLRRQMPDLAERFGQAGGVT